MDEIRFKRNPKSIIKGRFLSIVGTSLALLMVILGLMSRLMPIVIFFIGFLGLGIYFIRQSYRETDTVIVNQKGISSRVNGMGLIPWRFIEGLEIKEAVNAKVLVVEINNTEKLLRTVNAVSRRMMASNIKKLKSPVVIPQAEFHEPLEKAKEKIEEYRKGLIRSKS